MGFACAVMALAVAGCGTPPAGGQGAPPASGGATAKESPAGSPAQSAATTSTPASSTTATPTPAGGRSATVVMNGDLLWHNTLWFGAKEDAAKSSRKGADEYDFGPLLAGIKPVVEGADLAICHNEVPVAKPGGPYSGYPAFSSPPQTLDAVKATGYDACTTASNHSLDRGFEGLKNTLDQMDARGLKHEGTSRSAEEAERPTIITTSSGVRIGLVEGTYDTNGIPRPAGKEWSVADIDPQKLLRRAQATRRAGADIVLVAMHGGEEYQNAPNAQQKQLADVLTKSPDVDLVYGHHVHVVQPITKVNGKWVAYGHGNLVAQHLTTVPMGYEGITTRWTFTERAPGRFEVTAAEWLPTYVTKYSPGNPARVGFVNELLAAGKGDRARLQEAKRRTERIVGSLGEQPELQQR